MQGFNMGRYIPPDQEGLTTANKLHNKHPLGSRARHLQSKGALIVRFEMPFAVWCTNCSPENIIGQGVRFNAEKKKVGNYYSTPIYSFRMKHTLCGGWIEIRTDPKNTAYVVTEGGRRRDTGQADGTDLIGGGEILLGGRSATGAAAGDDPFARLEGKAEDKRVVDEARNRILELQRKQDRDWDDPYEVSKRLRRGFRAERKVLEKKEGIKEALKDKMSLGIEIVDEAEEDAVRAGMVEFEDGAFGAGVSTRAKPMFEPALSRPSGADKKMKGKGGSVKRKPADMVAERKALFRNELAGNTRAAVDPFLNGTEDSAHIWEPDVKKRKTPGKANGKKAEEGATGGGSDTQAKGAKSDVLEGQEKVPETKQSASQAVALVDYGSDSE
ncbi:CWC16 protein [Aspergillus spinulosporus]